MAIIAAYKLQPRALSFEKSAYKPYGKSTKEAAMYRHQYGEFVKGLGGYDPYAGSVTPMIFDPEADCHLYLDSMTGAVEAGLIDDKMWVDQLWHSPGDLDAFLGRYSDYDLCLRTVDRWWQMFSLLTGRLDEEGLVSSLEIAEQMALAAAEQTEQDDSDD